MKDRSNLIKLIDGGGVSLRRWAFDYLVKNNAISFHEEFKEHKKIGSYISNFRYTADTELLLNKMYAALAQRKQRAKRKDTKAYNFVMSTDVKNRLDSLAKELGKPLNETLESIIKEEYQKLRQIKEDARKAKKKPS